MYQPLWDHLRPARARRHIPVKMNKQSGQKSSLEDWFMSDLCTCFFSPVKDGEINTFQKGTEDKLRGTLSERLRVMLPSSQEMWWAFPTSQTNGISCLLPGNKVIREIRGSHFTGLLFYIGRSWDKIVNKLLSTGYS